MKKILVLWIPLLILCGCMAGCGTVDPAAFAVTSGSLDENGAWSDVITDTASGKNLSPQLSWTAVDGASCYAVYMLDATAGNWLHWRAVDVTGTELAEGANLGEYVGPYPPSGTHEYTVYVFALAAAADETPGNFNARSAGLKAIERALDVSGGQSGNLLAVASVTGTYTAK